MSGNWTARSYMQRIAAQNLDDAIDRGFDPGERPTPTPAHLNLPDDDPWMVALAASVEEAARWAS